VKVDQQPGYVLHRRSYRESSLLVEVFTRNFGRLALIAKGCRKKKSQVHGLFMSFKPVLLSWTGKGELPILTSIEQTTFYPQPDFSRVPSGYYMNELILKLLHRHDPHELLYDKYETSVFQLLNKDEPLAVLRVFEKHLLREIGFGLVLDHDVETGEALVKEGSYQYLPQKGPVAADSNQSGTVFGSTLIALEEEEFFTGREHRQARQLTKALIDIQLNGKELRTRRILREMKSYKDRFSHRG
jgi:DNA repair protein RecO (recombination protein O)